MKKENKKSRIDALTEKIKTEMDACPPQYLPFVNSIIDEKKKIDWKEFIAIYLKHSGRDGFNMDFITREIMRKGYLIPEMVACGKTIYRVSAQNTKDCEHLLSIREITSKSLCFLDIIEAKKFAKSYLDYCDRTGRAEMISIDTLDFVTRDLMRNTRATRQVPRKVTDAD
jgi:hypothetical protein